MARRKSTRIGVYKPEQHGRKWRIKLRDPIEGRIRHRSYDSEKEAWAGYRRALRAAQRRDTPTVGIVLNDYAKHLRKIRKPDSVRSTETRILSFFGDRAESVPVAMVTEKHIRDCYTARTGQVAVDTHRNELNETKAFFRWLVENRVLKASPAESVKGIGRRHKGKKQLHRSEARQFLAFCLEQADQGDNGALACVAMLLLGLRPNEFVWREVRDFDQADRILYIVDSKTESGKRTVAIPNLLWDRVAPRLVGKDQNQPVLPNYDGEFYSRYWANDNCKRLCAACGVPVVTAYSLRGCHATLARQAGATAHLVAAQLGHASETVTKEHYIRSGVDRQQTSDRALETLLSGEQSPELTH